MIRPEVRAFAEEAINRTCDRCHYGDGVTREQWHDGQFHWVHGVDSRGDILISPEPCDAQVLHELLCEMKADFRNPA